jgi:C-terminal processing protease CtpA/Prc
MQKVRTFPDATQSAPRSCGFNQNGEQRWMFQDVHEGGPAHTAGIRPGDILLQIRNLDLRPPDQPIFPAGEDSQYAIQKPDGKRVTGKLQVPSPKSKKHPVIVPKSVTFTGTRIRPASRDRGCMPTCIARKAIREMPLNGIVGLASPFAASHWMRNGSES